MDPENARLAKNLVAVIASTSDTESKLAMIAQCNNLLAQIAADLPQEIANVRHNLDQN